MWGGLGLEVWSRAPSQLQSEFGTDGTERLQGGKRGEESAVKAKVAFLKILKHPYKKGLRETGKTQR